jgi:hypothetical protein
LASSLASKQYFGFTTQVEAGRLVGLALSRSDTFYIVTKLETLGCSALGLAWGNRTVSAALPSGPFTVRTLLFLRLGAVLL